MCLVGVSRAGLFLLAHGSFSDAYGVCVFGWDTLVVEGWSSCVVVGVVLVIGQGGYFGELILAESALPGDLEWVVRQVRVCIKPPFQHFSLVLSGSASVGICSAFELGVDPSFQTVGGCYPAVGFDGLWWWVKVGE